jgi:outer membrane protein assembly factor BamB
VVTGNGVDDTFTKVTAPAAPSLVCFDKDNGRVLWTDASPGPNILDCQAASPLVAEIGGRVQVIVPQGDGWIRSFDAERGELIWEFDINYKEDRYQFGSRGDRNYVMATPVLYEQRIYIASGQQAEHGEGQGRLVCIDPTKTGDVSSQLAIDKDGNRLPYRRLQAVDPVMGEKAIPNPNSGLVWEFTKVEGSDEFEATMHRTLSTVAIHDDLVIAPDFSGLIHCLDAETGQRYWAYDTLAAIWASPLILGEFVYAPDEDGEVAVFRLSRDPDVAMNNKGAVYEPVAQIPHPESWIYASPVFANEVLYITTRNTLYAISAPRIPNSDLRSSRRPALEPAQLSSLRKLEVRAARPVFAPTPHDVVDRMLEAAAVTAIDTVVDLGSGDGRIIITAATKYAARGIGYETDAELVASSRLLAERASAANSVEIRHQDMYTADLSKARVVTVFLYPDALRKLRPQFDMMQSGARIVAHQYAIPGVAPDHELIVRSRETGRHHSLFLYTTPLMDQR